MGVRRRRGPGRRRAGRVGQGDGRRIAALLVRVAGLAWTAALGAPDGPLVAQAGPGPVPDAGVFAALEGSWEGTGTLLGRPGAFEMTWSTEADGFVRLSFSNAWVDGAGVRTPVLSARATYLPRGAEATGVWLDTRPQRLTLSAALTDSSVVTEWVAPRETGRTEYVVVAADSVVVRDFVHAEGEARLFAEATYRRRGR